MYPCYIFINVIDNSWQAVRDHVAVGSHIVSADIIDTPRQIVAKGVFPTRAKARSWGSQLEEENPCLTLKIRPAPSNPTAHH